MTNVVPTVYARIHDAILAAMDNLVIPRVELATNSLNVSFVRDPGFILLDPYQRSFSGNVEGLQMTASTTLNSNTDLNRIDDTRAANIPLRQLICRSVKKL